MAFPTVVDTQVTDGTVAASTATINLPGQGVIKGNDLLIIFFRCAVAGALTWPDSDWQELVDASPDGADDQVGIAWKRARGNEGTTVTMGANGNGKFAALSWLIRGDDMAIAPQLSTVATGSSATPDATSLSPTGGAKDYLWILMYCWEGEQNSGSSPPAAGPPSTYSNAIGADTGAAGAVTTNCQVASARKTANATSEDPGSWNIVTSDDWSAYVMAVHPAGPTPVNQPSLGGDKSCVLTKNGMISY